MRLQDILNHVQFHVEPAGKRDYDYSYGVPWHVTLRYQGRVMQSVFTTRRGKPDLFEVLSTWLDDASVEEYRDYKAWLWGYGYREHDHHEAFSRTMYEAVKRQTSELRGLLGSDFDTFMKARR